MRLGKNGEIIAETGFDGGSYTPRYASRTSLYLGDMSHEDIRIKKLVAAREAALARQEASARAIEKFKARQKMLVKDRMLSAIQGREKLAARLQEVARNKGYLAARKNANMMDINPWVGSPFAGFGQAGEQRINPDSNQDIEIVDAAIPSVSEYGINNWMEDPASVEAAVKDAEAAYTKGEQTLATLVDYAKRADLSVVGMPVASQVSQELRRAEQAVNQATVQEQPNYLKYGFYALAAYLILR